MRVVHCTEAGPDQQLIMGDYFSDLPKVPPMSQPHDCADPATSSWSAARAGARPRAWSRDPGRGRAAKIKFLQSAVSGGSWSGARVCHDDRPQPAAASSLSCASVRTWAHLTLAARCQVQGQARVQNMEVVLAAWIMSLTTTTTSPPSRRGGVSRGGTECGHRLLVLCLVVYNYLIVTSILLERHYYCFPLK